MFVARVGSDVSAAVLQSTSSPACSCGPRLGAPGMLSVAVQQALALDRVLDLAGRRADHPSCNCGAWAPQPDTTCLTRGLSMAEHNCQPRKWMPGRSRTASCGRRGGSEVSQVGMRRPCATRCITVNAAAATTIVPLPGCHERMRLGPIRRKDTLNILVRPYRAACRGREKSRGGNEPGLDERLPH